jgi:hypothetical protein
MANPGMFMGGIALTIIGIYLVIRESLAGDLMQGGIFFLYAAIFLWIIGAVLIWGGALAYPAGERFVAAHWERRSTGNKTSTRVFIPDHNEPVYHYPWSRGERKVAVREPMHSSPAVSAPVCPKCGAPVEQDWSYCPRCTSPLRT